MHLYLIIRQHIDTWLETLSTLCCTFTS